MRAYLWTGLLAQLHVARVAPPAKVAVAEAAVAVTVGVAIVEVAFARERARVIAEEGLIWAVVHACKHSIGSQDRDKCR